MQAVTTDTPVEKRNIELTVASIRLAKAYDGPTPKFLFIITFNEQPENYFFWQTEKDSELVIGTKYKFHLTQKGDALNAKLAKDKGQDKFNRNLEVQIYSEALGLANQLYIAGKIPFNKIKDSATYFENVIKDRFRF